MPAAAPRSVSPRHQMPSTSSGQNDDAATAKARPTTSDTSRLATRSDEHERHHPGHDGGDAEVAHRSLAQDVGGEHAGHRGEQPGGAGQERGEGAGRDQRAQQLPGRTVAQDEAGQHQHDGVGVAGEHQRGA